MAKTKKQGFSLQGFDANHIQQTENYTQAVDALYNQAVAEYARLASRLNINPDKPFSFADYPGTKAKADSIISELSGKMQAVIVKGSAEQWLYASKKNDAFLASILDTSKINPKKLAKYQDRNLNALKTFQSRKVNGLGLSDRVWDYSKQMKTQMELGIDVAIGEGKSALTLSRELKQYLVDPDKLFRRVRDKRGMLQLSKNAAAFHPGQGKYRSSHKNAMRLTRSEINMAYRESDQLRWKQLDFVVGIEVRLSNNHTLNGVPFVDICDDLKGKYPKDFKFVGWHPQCRCKAIPILQDPKEFDTSELNELKAAINGTQYQPFQSANAITDMPKGFNDWAEENEERSKGWKSQPYFIKDNFKGGKISGGLDIGNAMKVAQATEKVAKTTPEEIITLYRGDLRDKGDDFSNDMGMMDYVSWNGEAKNKGGYYFFTDKIKEAKDYALETLADSRGVVSSPNLTTIKADISKMLDISNVDPNKGGVEMFNILNKKLYNGKMTLEDFQMLQNGTLEIEGTEYLKKIAMEELSNLFESLKNGTYEFNLGGVSLSNGEKGVYFKKMLDKKGFTGYIFRDSHVNDNAKHYAFIGKIFKVIKRESLK